MNKKIKPINLILAVFGTLFLLLLMISAVESIGSWNQPTGIPPTENVPTPINTGDNFQFREGPLGINNLVWASAIRIDGAYGGGCGEETVGLISVGGGDATVCLEFDGEYQAKSLIAR